MNKEITIGILAHVDAGKTTLSEEILYKTGAIRSHGRVDHGDTFLDTDELEKRRGITIYSAQASFSHKDTTVHLFDTPGHVDFSGEVERSLPVLDYAVLLINGNEGIQSHTRTLFSLLERYHVPAFLFVNKMDISHRSQEELLIDIKKILSSDCVDASSGDFYEEAATADEALLDTYMDKGSIPDSLIAEAVSERKLFPVFFGSALKSDGIDALLDALSSYTKAPVYPEEFGALAYKVGRDGNGVRRTYLKITGGSLSVRDTVLPYGAYPDEAKKVNEIRLVYGEKSDAVNKVDAGMLCAVTGIDDSYPGQGFGITEDASLPVLTPVLSYRAVLPEGSDPHPYLMALQELTDEDPLLHVSWEERLQEIRLSIMGKIQLEVLKEKLSTRYGLEIDFGVGNIIYRETIGGPSIGHGHYEPLKHFADVVLSMEPLPEGSGIIAETELKPEILPKNYQHQILNRLRKREIPGVLTGSALTDVKFTLIGGKAHKKHTEGGDFRKATEIAIRDGLLRTDNLVLEPFYHVTLEIPQDSIGRAMTDLTAMQGTVGTPEMTNDLCILEGDVPVALAMDYSVKVQSYTGGLGHVRMELSGFYPCHNSDEVIEEKAYDFKADLRHPYESVYVHQENPDAPPPCLMEEEEATPPVKAASESPRAKSSGSLSLDDELMQIFEKTYGEVRRTLPADRKVLSSKSENARAAREEYLSAHPARIEKQKNKGIRKKYLLVDGYNVIFSWDDLKELADLDLNAARDKLLDILSNYQGFTGYELIAVFDAYKVKGHPGEVLSYHNIHVVYTKEAQTADAYIERATHEIAKKDNADITVVSSDGLIQMIVLGEGAVRISSREFASEVKRVGEGFIS